jgi:hypothetical protein
MAAKIEIDIVGIAIGYMKDGQWYVMFPVDEEGCHKVEFKSKKDGENEISHGSLANADLVEIEIDGESTTPTIPAEPSFYAHIYNLTDTTTHPKVRKKETTGKYVLMNIPNAQFSIRRSVPDTIFGVKVSFPLVEVNNPLPVKWITPLAHSAKATIILDTDAQVKVKVDGTDIFTTDANASYTLTFNNDCVEMPVRKNDMDLYYEVIEEYDPITDNPIPRQFRIGFFGLVPESVSEKDFAAFRQVKILKDPPNALSVMGGNTCLFAQVTDKDSIAKLPPYSQELASDLTGEDSNQPDNF